MPKKIMAGMLRHLITFQSEGDTSWSDVSNGTAYAHIEVTAANELYMGEQTQSEIIYNVYIRYPHFMVSPAWRVKVTVGAGAPASAIRYRIFRIETAEEYGFNAEFMKLRCRELYKESIKYGSP